MLRVTSVGGVNYGLLGIALALASGSLAGCGSEQEPVSQSSSRYEVAEDTQPAAAAPPSTPAAGTSERLQPDDSASTPVPQVPLQKPPALSGAELNDYSAPAGGPDVLAAEIDKLNESLRQLALPSSPNPMALEAWLSEARPILQAKLAVADKMSEQQGLSEPLRRAALRAKLEALGGLATAGDNQLREQLTQVATKVAQDGDTQLAGLANLALMEARLMLMSESEQERESPGEELAALLASAPAGEFEYANLFMAACALLRTGAHQPAVDVFHVIGETFQSSADQELARRAGDLLEQSKRLDFQVKLLGVMEEKPGAMAALLQSASAMLQNPDGGALGLIGQAAMNLEYSGEMENAGKLYELVRSAFANHADPELAEYAKQVLGGYDQRAALLGKPLEIQGVTADGQPLDWSRYAGKVVLVDFWATWCGPCLQEMPNLAANYERYREQGFEIIGVNLDDQPAAAKEFLAQQPLPWTIVFSSDPAASGFENPLAVKCGVEAIPFLVLIGADGNVMALHLRGEKLGEKLAQMLGEPGGGAAPSP